MEDEVDRVPAYVRILLRAPPRNVDSPPSFVKGNSWNTSLHWAAFDFEQETSSYGNRTFTDRPYGVAGRPGRILPVGGKLFPVWDGLGKAREAAETRKTTGGARGGRVFREWARATGQVASVVLSLIA